MHIAKVSLIFLVAFGLILGCGLFGEKIQEVTFDVTGMTWGACTSKVQEALKNTPGVTEVVSVSDESNTAVVKIEKSKVSADKVAKVITDTGFSAKVAE